MGLVDGIVPAAVIPVGYILMLRQRAGVSLFVLSHKIHPFHQERAELWQRLNKFCKLLVLLLCPC